MSITGLKIKILNEINKKNRGAREDSLLILGSEESLSRKPLLQNHIDLSSGSMSLNQLLKEYFSTFISSRKIIFKMWGIKHGEYSYGCEAITVFFINI